MKKIQSGFTLIEVMIVVTIIAILAAVALPAYQNYTKRSHVSEGLSLASGVKASVAEHYAARGSWPADSTAANIPGNIDGEAVTQVYVSNGIVVVEFNQSVEAGKSIELSPYADTGSIKWACRSANADGVSTLYLPERCRT